MRPFASHSGSEPATRLVTDGPGTAGWRHDHRRTTDSDH